MSSGRRPSKACAARTRSGCAPLPAVASSCAQPPARVQLPSVLLGGQGSSHTCPDPSVLVLACSARPSDMAARSGAHARLPGPAVVGCRALRRLPRRQVSGRQLDRPAAVLVDGRLERTHRCRCALSRWRQDSGSTPQHASRGARVRAGRQSERATDRCRPPRSARRPPDLSWVTLGSARAMRPAGLGLCLALLAGTASAALYQRPINQDCVSSPGSAVNYFPQDYHVQGLAGNTQTAQDVVTASLGRHLACARPSRRPGQLKGALCRCPLRRASQSSTTTHTRRALVRSTGLGGPGGRSLSRAWRTGREEQPGQRDVCAVPVRPTGAQQRAAARRGQAVQHTPDQRVRGRHHPPGLHGALPASACSADSGQPQPRGLPAADAARAPGAGKPAALPHLLSRLCRRRRSGRLQLGRHATPRPGRGQVPLRLVRTQGPSPALRRTCWA